MSKRTVLITICDLCEKRKQRGITIKSLDFCEDCTWTIYQKIIEYIRQEAEVKS